ncbi:hypothetical protein ABZ383_29880, partial [Streptomyces sp. NPDC005900]
MTASPAAARRPAPAAPAEVPTGAPTGTPTGSAPADAPTGSPPADVPTATPTGSAPTGSTPAHAPTSAPPAAGRASWEELITAALLGTDRRALPADLTAPGRTAPAALLDEAAVQTVRRRAGLRPAPAATPPEPAARDPRPPVPPAA